MKLILLLTVTLLSTTLAQRSQSKCEAQATLVSDLTPTTGNSVRGRVEYSPEWSKTSKKCFTRIRASIVGLDRNAKHGFHIHTYGDNKLGDGTAAGGHFTNPKGKNVTHGLPDDKKRHWGDMGNLMADRKGRAKYDEVDGVISLSGILGRGVVVHALGDLGRGSQPTGGAGGRVAFGVIGVGNGEFVGML